MSEQNPNTPTTPTYGFETPTQEEFYDVDVQNRNVVRTEQALEELANRSVDVTGDVTQVINERVNTDTTKPLNQLISGWITSAKDSVLNAITTLTSHVTNKATEVKSHMTTRATEIKGHVTSETSGVESHVTSQHTTTKQHVSTERATTVNAVNSARDNIKAHVTSQLSIMQGYVPGTSKTLASFSCSPILTKEITSDTNNPNAYGFRKAGVFVPPLTGIVQIELDMTITSSYSNKVYARCVAVSDEGVYYASEKAFRPDYNELYLPTGAYWGHAYWSTVAGPPGGMMFVEDVKGTGRGTYVAKVFVQKGVPIGIWAGCMYDFYYTYPMIQATGTVHRLQIKADII